VLKKLASDLSVSQDKARTEVGKPLSAGSVAVTEDISDGTLGRPHRLRLRKVGPPLSCGGFSFQPPCWDIEKAPRIPIGADKVII